MRFTARLGIAVVALGATLLACVGDSDESETCQQLQVDYIRQRAVYDEAVEMLEYESTRERPQTPEREADIEAQRLVVDDAWEPVAVTLDTAGEVGCVWQTQVT